MSPRARWAAVAGGAMLLLALGFGGWRFAAFARQGPIRYGTAPVGKRAAFPFELKGAQGKSVRMADYRGKAVYVFFGFSHCPDICPTTLMDLKRLYLSLEPAEQKQVQVVMISVDPARDTPERMTEFARYFHPSFVGLTASDQEIRRTAIEYGVTYSKGEAKAGDYTMAHTASVFLVDPQGNLAGIYALGQATQTAKMVEDLRRVL